MKDCGGNFHLGSDPITWREFDREMTHRDRLAEQKEHDLQREMERKAKDVADIAERRAASNRLLVAIVAIVVPVVLTLLQLWITRR